MHLRIPSFGSKKIKLSTSMLIYAFVVPAAVVATIYTGLDARYQRSLESRIAKSETHKLTAVPEVRVVCATHSSATKSVTLTGEADPYLSVTLYSKVSGYLKDINVDKGDKVSAGQLLAIVDSPELDQQYEAAVADAKDKRLDADRGQFLIKSGSISEEQYDKEESAAEVAESKAAALKTEKDYQQIRAPFSGLITARFADPGALIQQAVQEESPDLPIVTLAQTDRLRVYVYPHEKDAQLIKVGDRAEIWTPSRPDAKVPGRVTRTSGNINTRTQTLRVEIDVDNHAMNIVPGSFVKVALSMQNASTADVPVGALLRRGKKHFVAVVGSDNKVSLRPVTVYDNDGTVASLCDGISAGERVALDVSDDIKPGCEVRPMSDPVRITTQQHSGQGAGSHAH